MQPNSVNENLEDDSDDEEDEDRGQSGEGLKKTAFCGVFVVKRWEALPDQEVFIDDWKTRASIIMETWRVVHMLSWRKVNKETLAE